MLSNHPSVLGGGAVSVTTPAATSASLDLISSTQGAMLYRNATEWVGLGPGTSGQLLSTQGAAANPLWVTATGGAGDMNGPASATDNAIVRFDGTGGKTVQNSAVTIADTTGDIAGASSLTAPASTDLTLSGGSTSGKILFNSPSATERARLTTTGNLLIGTTTDMTGSGGLKIAGTTAATTTTSGALIVAGGVGVSGAGYFGGTLSVTGVAAVGTSTDASTALDVRGALTGASQYGIAAQPVFSSGATSSGSTSYFQMRTAVAAYTMATGTVIEIPVPAIGATSAVTTLKGISIANQGAASVTNAYGIDIAAQSGAATTNIGLRNAGITSLTNSTAATTTTSGALIVAGGVGVSGAGYFGGNVVSNSGSNPIFSAAISGTSIGSFSAFGADVYIGVDQNANGNIIFRRNSATESMRITGSNGSVNITSTVSASAATTGALTIGNGTAATNVAIGGGNINAGGTLTVGGQSNFGADLVSTAAGTFRLTANSTNQVNIGNNGANTSALVVIPSGSGTSLTLNGVTGATFAGAVSASGTTATWTSGTGSPESVKTAPVGSLYTRTDGGASTTLYVKESGAGNTGWIAK